MLKIWCFALLIVIDELQLKVFGSLGFNATDKVFATLGKSAMAPGATYALSVPYASAQVGTLQEVKIIPRVKVVGRSEYAYCTDAALTFSDISLC